MVDVFLTIAQGMLRNFIVPFGICALIMHQVLTRYGHRYSLFDKRKYIVVGFIVLYVLIQYACVQLWPINFSVKG